MEKLALSKAIMDKAEGIKSTRTMNDGLPPTSLQQFDAPAAKYNIPDEFLRENNSVQQPYLSEVPRENTKPVGVPTVDAIKNSKLPDEIKGEIAKAYIVLKTNANCTEDEIMAFCHQSLAAYKCPRKVQFVDDVPKTSTGKIMRRALHTLDV